MGDYGFRISATGVDVKTGDDKDMVVTSKYPMLKGFLSGSGSVSVAQNGTVSTVTIPHNLGYIPIVQAFAIDVNGAYFYQEYFRMPLYDFTLAEIGWRVYANSTNVYLQFFYDDGGAGGSNVAVNYTYYIFIDKGKL